MSAFSGRLTIQTLSVMKAYSQYNPYKDFNTLEAWIRVRELKLFLYSEVIPMLPAEEKFNLNVQIRKSAVSGTANIAEGYGRHNYKDSIRFYRISRGSIYESKDHLMSCYDLHYISHPVLDRGLVLIEKAKAALNGYIKYIKSRGAEMDH